jgi:hypothetical protein
VLPTCQKLAASGSFFRRFVPFRFRLLFERRDGRPTTLKQRFRYESHKNGSKRQHMAASRWSFAPSCSARRRPGTGVFGGWAELRSLERKPHIWRTLCQLIPSDTRNVGPWLEGVESPLFDRDNYASKARTSAGAASNHHFRDVKSICQRLFIPITSPRRGRGRPQAG